MQSSDGSCTSSSAELLDHFFNLRPDRANVFIRALWSDLGDSTQDFLDVHKSDNTSCIYQL